MPIANPQSIVKTKGILVADGRAMQLFTGGPRGARSTPRRSTATPPRCARAKLYAMIVPTAQTYYLPENWTGRVHHEPANIQATYAMLDPSVTPIDVVGALKGHESENIYFRTDHHWTSLAAYYAYAGFCQAAGFKPISLDPANKRTIKPYRGSLYRYTRETKNGKTVDEIDYWLPNANASVERWSPEASKPAKGSLLHESSKGYGVFLGGDHALMVAKTSNHSGRRALLIKNSYGNPFAVYLVEHFDTVVIVDYRKFEGDVLDLVDEHQITDLIILNGAITANAKGHIARIAQLLNAGKRVPKRPSPSE